LPAPDAGAAIFRAYHHPRAGFFEVAAAENVSPGRPADDHRAADRAAAPAQELRQRQQRRDPDAPAHQHRRLDAAGQAEPAAQRAEQVNLFTCFHAGQQQGAFPRNPIEDLNAGR